MVSTDLAQKTLETLRNWRKHRAQCQQCHIDKDFCRTRQTYSDIFETRYYEWDQVQTLGELNAKASKTPTPTPTNS